MKSHRATVVTLGFVVVLMAGFGYALVPLYNVMCDVFDINGKTSNEIASLPTAVDEQRLVKVQFVTTLNEYMPWDFAPEQEMVSVHPGELTEVLFKVHNKTGHAMTGQAIPSISPSRAADYMKKLECFCFDQQSMAANETKEMVLRFYVDPLLPKDVHRLTLSYTFFDVGKTAQSRL